MGNLTPKRVQSNLQSRVWTSWALLILAAGLAAGPQAIAAQGVLDGAAFSVPVSDRVIEGELIFGDDSRVGFKVREGMMLTIRIQGGQSYGLSPLVEDNGEVQFAVYELERSTAGERVREVGEFVTGVGGTSAAPTAMPLDVAVLDVSSRKFSVPPPDDPASLTPEDLRGTYGLTDCCVNCGTRTICGCSVETSCGSCCSGECCLGGGGGSPRFQPSQ